MADFLKIMRQTGYRFVFGNSSLAICGKTLKMITAEEAKNLAFAHKKPENNFEWTKEIVYKRIEDAAKSGEFEVIIDLRFLPDRGVHFVDLQKHLIADGYEINTVIDNKFGNFIISWKGTEN